jgi:DNA (cytosine-5)-methyltransferase 1
MEKEKLKEMISNLKIFSMFSGYGGAEFALKKAGVDFEIVGYSEIDKNAIKCYEQNHKGKNFGDCKNINPNGLPDFDLLTGGFPCQPFSINTNQNAAGVKHSSYNLFEEIIKIVRVKKPKWILLENVKGILGDKYKEVYDRLFLELKEIGYDLRIEVLNSKDYGIPQNRERVFFVGKLGGLNNFNFPPREELKKSVKDFLESNVTRREPSIKKMKLNKKINQEKFGSISRYEAIMKSPVIKKNSNVLFEILDAPSDKVSRQSDRIYSFKYAPCLTATGKDYVFYDGENTIVLTPRECFRLMGFTNDEIKLEGLNDNQRYKLVGNGWDINLVSKIFNELFIR